jgi:dienelactone hydrolase
MKLKVTTAIVLTLAATSLVSQPGFAHESNKSKPQTGARHMTTKMLKVGEKTLAYVQSGSGPAVVIVHGVGGHKEDWQGVAAALANTHTVFAIDMLGFGESSKTGDDLSMPVQAAAIKALLDEHRQFGRRLGRDDLCRDLSR